MTATRGFQYLNLSPSHTLNVLLSAVDTIGFVSTTTQNKQIFQFLIRCDNNDYGLSTKSSILQNRGA